MCAARVHELDNIATLFVNTIHLEKYVYCAAVQFVLCTLRIGGVHDPYIVHAKILFINGFL